MKNFCYKIIALMSCIFLLFSKADGMEDSLDHNSIKSFLETHSSQYEQLMGSSIDKNIVVFLGNTGAGKSTLINYLSGKELWCDERGRVDLRNLDENSMRIGHNRGSETSLPQSMAVTIEQENFQFYDLPGFHDNRGITNNLFNASFIKSIVENARTVRCVFVVSMAELGVQRGEIFHNLTQDLEDLIRNQDISDISCLVISKCRNEIRMRDRLENWFPAETAGWREAGKVAKMYEPNENERVLPNDIQPIINVIKRTTARKIVNVNISSIFSYEDRGKLRYIFNEEISKISANIIERNGFQNLELEGLRAKKRFYERNFSGEVLENFEASRLVSLLSPITHDQYELSRRTIPETVELGKQKQISRIDSLIFDKERCEAEIKRLKEESEAREKLRIAQEEAQEAERTAEKAEKRAKKAERRARERAEKARKKKIDKVSSSSGNVERQQNVPQAAAPEREYDQRVRWRPIEGIWTITESRDKGGEWEIDGLPWSKR